MKGYVENKTPMWAHAMKRSIGPGAKVPLNELYEQYGAKHGLEKGEEFVAWLKGIKLKDNSKWNVVYDGMSGETKCEETSLPTESLDSIDSVRKVRPPKKEGWKAQKPIKRVEITTYDDERSTQREEKDSIDVAPNKLSVNDLSLLSVRKAREVVPHIVDKKLLQYALEEASARPGGDSLCMVLRKRIKQLETIVR